MPRYIPIPMHAGFSVEEFTPEARIAELREDFVQAIHSSLSGFTENMEDSDGLGGALLASIDPQNTRSYEATVVESLANLRIFCDEHGIDFQKALDQSALEAPHMGIEGA